MRLKTFPRCTAIKMQTVLHAFEGSHIQTWQLEEMGTFGLSINMRKCD